MNKASLLAIIQPLTGLSQFAVFWAKDPERPVNPIDRGHVTLNVRVFSPYGTDEHEQSYNSGNGILSTYTVGQRQVRLTLLAESFDYDLEASEILEKVRVGIFDPDVLLSLTPINLAFQSCSPTQDIRTVVEDREVNVSTMDIFFGAQAVTDPKAPADGTPGWISTVDGGLPPPINVS